MSKQFQTPTRFVPLALLATLLALGCSAQIGSSATPDGGHPGGAKGPGDGDVSDGDGGDGDGGDGDGPPRLDPIGEADLDLGAPEVPRNATHYCDCGDAASEQCVAGSDESGDGTIENPYRTGEHARTTMLDSGCGDAVLLCKGGHFDAWDGGQWVPTGALCEPGDYRKLGTYDPPWASDERPLITGTRTFFEHTNTEDPNGGLEVEGLHLRCVDCEADDTNRGFQFYGGQKNWLIEDVVIDGFALGVQLGSDGQQANAERIIVARSFFINNTRAGILGAADQMTVHDSVFRHNACMQYSADQGQQCALDHAWYIDGGENAETGNSRFQNVTLRDSVFEDNCNVGDSGVCSCAVVVNRGQTNLLIERNTFINNLDFESRCVAVDGTGTSSGRVESCLGCTIRDNQFVGGWTRAVQIGGAPDLIVENNVFQMAEAETFPVHCAAIQVHPVRQSDGGSEERESDNLTIRNNSIYFDADLLDPSDKHEECVGVEIADEGGSHVIVNNAIYLTGDAELDCFSIKAGSDAIEAMDHNVCDRAGNGSFDWNKAGEDLDTWRAQTGLDANSRRIDPAFTDAATRYPDADFSAADGSPMIDGGDATHASATSIEGAERGPSPDIGAYEQ